MKVVGIIKVFCASWFWPMLLFVVNFLICAATSIYSNNRVVKNFSLYFYCASILLLIVSIIYKLVTREYIRFLLTLIIGFGLFYFFSSALFWILQSTPDNYADNLRIPTNIKVYSPSDTAFSALRITPDFHLYNSIQNGIYAYSVNLKRIERGYCYLKAFEVTQNDPLSREELIERTRIEVVNLSDAAKVFRMGKDYNNRDRDFTIYEGDWGKPYAARFEVWFVPKSGGKERKLTEKNYRIEGWMR